MTKRHILLEGLESTPSDIGRLVRRGNAPDADWRPSEDAASTRDIVLKLITNDHEIQHIVGVGSPHDDGRIAPDDSPEQTYLVTMPITDLVDVFAVTRRATIDILNQLSPGAWQRVVERPSGPPVSVRFAVQDLVERDIALTDQLISTGRAWIRKTSEDSAKGHI